MSNQAMQKAVKRMTVPLVTPPLQTVLAFTPMAILQGPLVIFWGVWLLRHRELVMS